MREAKYRAWYKPLGVMIDPKDLVMIEFEAKFIGAYILIDGKGYNRLRLSDCELLQYTGLQDKNGREIYEGDILKDAAGVGEVEWVQEHCAYMIFTREPSFYYHLECDGQLKVSEVVGNIYENPELLEV